MRVLGVLPIMAGLVLAGIQISQSSDPDPYEGGGTVSYGTIDIDWNDDGDYLDGGEGGIWADYVDADSDGFVERVLVYTQGPTWSLVWMPGIGVYRDVQNDAQFGVDCLLPDYPDIGCNTVKGTVSQPCNGNGGCASGTCGPAR